MPSCFRRYKTGLLWTFFLLVLMIPCAQAQDAPKAAVKLSSQDCFDCHADNAPVIDPKIFNNSVHQSLACVDCHTDIKEVPHADKLKKVDCSTCHEKESRQWQSSAHGLSSVSQQSKKAAGCSDCHGKHDISKTTIPTSKLYWANIPKTCGECHQKEYLEYSRGIHGTALAQVRQLGAK